MARKLATLAQTSGIGYDYEDQVAAYLMVCLLKNDPPLTEELGGLIRLEFNTRVHGWFLDDLLLTFQINSRLALSVKSNIQITASGINPSFVKDAWEQYSTNADNPFDTSKDYMGIISAPLDAETMNSLSEIQQYASVMDEVRFIAEVESKDSSNVIKRAIWGSLQCPPNIETQNNFTKEDAVRMLRRLQFLQLDFRNLPSQDRKQALTNCRALLRSGDTEEANSLWQKLLHIAKRFRSNGGYIDLERLLSELNFKFELKSWPQYEHDFETIIRHTRRELEAIPDKIGQSIHIPREQLIEQIQINVNTNSLFAILVESGCGKSVITRKWAEAGVNIHPILWIHAKDLSHQNFYDFETKLHLNHSLEELGGAVTTQYAYCVIDGVENIVNEESLKIVKSIVHTLKIGQVNTRWRLLLICQTEEWLHSSANLEIYLELDKCIESLTVESPSHQEYTEVYQAFPQLGALSIQKNLNTILRRPKIVDVIVKGLLANTSINLPDWLGEASIADWHWRTQVATGNNQIIRGQAMMHIAEMQADSILPDIGLSEAPIGSDELLSCDLLIVRDNRISFQHDLFGDWTRLQSLKQHVNDFATFVNLKLASPFWNRSVRLYGLHLLELDATGECWFKTISDLSVAENGSDAQDLMLEAVFHASNPKPLFERTWTYLVANDGELLKRMLRRFLHTGTISNQSLVALGESEIQKMRYATKNRLPYWTFWQPMISLLYEHKTQVLELVPALLAEIAYTWLSFARIYLQQNELTSIKEAADMAITLAEMMLDNEESYKLNTEEVSPTAFKSALMSYEQFPDRVRNFVLKASGRIERKKRENIFPGNPQKHSTYRPMLSIPGRYRKKLENVLTWTDGPVVVGNKHFEKICLKEQSLLPLILSNPELAAEILLALLIETPTEYQEDYGRTIRLPGEECQIKNHSSHYPPFWWHSSWFIFLRTKPEIAIDTILKLVNFASERRREALPIQDRSSLSITFFDDQNTYTWFGDMQVYMWYRASWGPHAVSSVLMSLEHWLYELLEQGVPVIDYLTRIRDNSSSLAFAGLLAAVASKHLVLLKGPLKFLLSSWELLRWDNQRYVQDSVASTPMIAWTGHHQSDIKTAYEWHSMPHRKLSFQQISQQIFLTEGELRPFFEEVCERWKNAEAERRAIGQIDIADYLGFRINVYNLDNYYQTQNEDGQISIHYQAPQDIEEKIELKRRQNNVETLQMYFPLRCRQILDGKNVLENEVQLEAFWEEGQQILSNYKSDSGSMICIEDISSGIAAVLLIKYSEWLKHFPDREIWCKQQITETIVNPPVMYRNITGVIDNWQIFCAVALPSVWLEDLESEHIRLSILLLALSPHDKVVSTFSKRCYELRAELGHAYSQLVALWRHWVIERPQLLIRQDFANDGFCLRSHERLNIGEILNFEKPALDAMLSKNFQEVVQGFIKGELPIKSPSLSEVEPSSEGVSDVPRRPDNRRRRQNYVVCITSLKNIYSFWNEHPLPIDIVDRQECLVLWQELLECFLETMKPRVSAESDLEIEGDFYKEDRWLLERIASLIVQMEPSENPELFWRPILDLGWQANDYIEHFLFSFLVYNFDKLENETFSEKFANLWTSMFKYADQSSGWNRTASNRFRPLDTLWQKMIGISWYAPSPWNEKHQKLILTISPLHKIFCSKRLTNSDTTEKYLRFLYCPAAKLIRLKALFWVEPKLEDYQFEDRYTLTEEALAELAVTCWAEHERELRRSHDTFDCYKRILRKLASRQNAIAMALQEKILES